MNCFVLLSQLMWKNKTKRHGNSIPINKNGESKGYYGFSMTTNAVIFTFLDTLDFSDIVTLHSVLIQRSIQCILRILSYFYETFTN